MQSPEIYGPALVVLVLWSPRRTVRPEARSMIEMIIIEMIEMIIIEMTNNEIASSKSKVKGDLR